MATCGCSSEATPLIRTQSRNPRNSPLIILGTLCTPGWWLGLGCCDQIARDQFGKSEISARRFFVFLLSELNPGHAISYRVVAAAKYLYALSGVFLYFCLKHIPQTRYIKFQVTSKNVYVIKIFYWTKTFLGKNDRARFAGRDLQIHQPDREGVLRAAIPGQW